MMDKIRHHLSDALLMAYSAGDLPEAFSLVIATHASICDDCRARLETLDCVGGAVLAGCEGVQMSADSLSATLAMIADQDAQAEVRQVRKRGIFPQPLQDYVGGDLDDVKWKSLGGGVRQAVLKTSADASVRLLRIPGGTKLPDHGHRGIEMTLVLQGAFRDEQDRFGRGDIEIADEDVNHTPIAEEGEDCICLAATDAPLKFNDLMARIAQPFLRI